MKKARKYGLFLGSWHRESDSTIRPIDAAFMRFFIFRVNFVSTNLKIPLPDLSDRGNF